MKYGIPTLASCPLMKVGSGSPSSTSLHRAKQEIIYIVRFTVMNVLLRESIMFMFLAKSSTNITLEQWPGGKWDLFVVSLPWPIMTYIANHFSFQERGYGNQDGDATYTQGRS